jgi:hypothetical protein
MAVKACPSHPAYPLDKCPRCAALIERTEDARSGLWAVDEDSRADEDRYERHVGGDEWGGSVDVVG